MKLFIVSGCVTNIDGAVPYLRQPAADKAGAIDAWYTTACEIIGVNPDAMPPANAEHQDLIDTAHALRICSVAFRDGEALALHCIEVEPAA